MLVPLQKPSTDVSFSKESEVLRANEEMRKCYETVINNLLKMEKLLKREAYESRGSSGGENQWSENLDVVGDSCKTTAQKCIALKRDLLSTYQSVINAYKGSWW